MQHLLTYIRDAVSELRHVRWPTRQQAVRLSVIVILFTLTCTAIFGVIDFGLSTLLKELLTVAG